MLRPLPERRFVYCLTALRVLDCVPLPCLLQGNPEQQKPDVEAGLQHPGDDKEGGGLLCIACRALITRHSCRMEVNGAHRHIFTNPHGFVFRIGCFHDAPGVVPVSTEQDTFTWFPGYRWRVLACAACGSHPGWSFHSSRQHFFGLILDRLVEEQDRSA